ncbi:glycosyltransferase family 2 protein [Patescibacteria group bacterium]
MNKLSVVLSVRNEEKNIGKCLDSVKDIANEIVVVDEHSTDKTCEIAKKYDAKVYSEPHHDIFHVTKQKALDHATGDWILQLDADEVVTPGLAGEIKQVLNGTHSVVVNKLFERHQKAVEERDGSIGTKEGEVSGYFIPRKNMFLGKPLIHAGVYPDGVIRLVRRGKAHFPQKSVHEQIIIDGKVEWLKNDLEHHDSPSLKRYFARMNRYTDLRAQGFASQKVTKNLWSLLRYAFYAPLLTYCNLFFRHLGFLDGARGFLWSFFSAMHYPISYFKYLTGGYNK